MAEFNPDEYLSEKKEEFNPDWYLSEGTDENSTLKDIARVATKSLPMVGSVGGGIIAGGPTLGAAALGGSALGAMAGRAAQTLIEENFLDEKPKSIEEKVTELPKEAVYDVAGNLVGGKIVGPALGALAKPLTKLSSAFSGVPEQSIETYAKNYDDVTKIDDVALEADRIRQSAQDYIKSFKSVQNERISEGLSKKAGEYVDVSGARKVLEENLSKVNPEINPQLADKIRNQIDLIDNLSSRKQEGDFIGIPAADAYALQKKWQDLAEYMPDSSILKRKDFSDITLQRAAGRVRQSLNQVAPEISQANAELAKIRRIDKNINKNLITPEKPYLAMTSVGSGQNKGMENQVKKLGSVVGQDFLTPMQNLASAQKLGNADYISGMTTGRATLPLIAGSAVGSQLGPIPGIASALLTTPIGIKGAIGTAKAAQKIGLTPSRTSSELIQLFGPEIEKYTKDKLKEQQTNELLQQAQQLSVSPYDTEQTILKSQDLTPSQKAKAIKMNSRR